MKAPTVETKKAETAPPCFRRRFWYNPYKLDARPVIWSLDNRPEEWVRIQGRWLRHKSGHQISLRGYDDFGMIGDTDCGCYNRSWQPFQRVAMRLAQRRWLKWEALNTGLAAQFQSHFLSGE